MIAVPTKESVRKAYNDKMISKKVYDSISPLFKSKSSEDIIFSAMIIRTELTKNLCANLNDEQTQVFKDVLEYIYTDIKDDDVRACLINGSAGTGKTTTMSKILYAVSILSPKSDVNVNAPTHKAIKLLESKCDNIYNCQQFSFGTTHHSLGLRMVVESDGKVKFKGNPNTTTSFQLMVVDEVSMIEDELFKLILDSKTYSKTKIVLMGDRKQLPPVNSKDSYIFTHAKDHKVQQMNLTKIVRQVADNPIVKLTAEIGEHIDEVTPLTLKQELTEDKDGVIIRQESQLENLIKYWFNLEQAKTDSNFIRILAWTNSMVNKCNILARNILFNNPTNAFERGERIIASEPLFFQNKQIADNSDEFTVLNCDIITLHKVVPISYEPIELKFYQIEVEEIGEPIRIVHKDSRPLYEQKLDDLKNYCIRKKDAKIWTKYYEMCQWDNKINYAYAGTVHKSQGSTYENTIVLLKDIEKNQRFQEKNKLRYTAFTRAKKKLIIVCSAISKTIKI